MHNLTKTTLSNVLKGESAAFWKFQQKQVKSDINNCGVCRRFDEKLCRPQLGKSLFRCRVGSPPFEYVSLDPLGSVRVQMTGSHTGKITPLIVCDLNTGAVCVQHMLGVKAQHIFMALQCLQYRFGTEVIMGFTDAGSQLGKSLGKKCDFWSRKLAGIIKLYNNAAMCQFRNVCERKVRILKRLSRMGISGRPGPQTTTDTIELDTYYCLMEQAVYGLNSIPYLAVGNYGLLTPQHMINPWTNGRVRVREIPSGSVKELRDLRAILVNQMTNLNEQIMEEITIDVKRWKQEKLKLGKNKSEESVSIGDIVMLKREHKNDVAQFGLVIEIHSQNKNIVIKLQSGYCMDTAVGNVVPVASGQADGREQREKMGRVGQEFTHFVSVGISGERDLESIRAFQDKLSDVPGIGKKKNPKKMHITLGVFNILQEEIDDADMRFKREVH